MQILGTLQLKKAKKLYQVNKNMILMLKERKNLSILIKQAQHMKVNGMVVLEMDMVHKYGQMEQSMKVIGIMVELKVKESLPI